MNDSFAEGENQEAPISLVISRALAPVMIAWLFIPLTFFIPLVDSTRAPYVDLTQTLAEFAYWLAWTGSKFGVPFVALPLLIVLVTRDGINAMRK